MSNARLLGGDELVARAGGRDSPVRYMRPVLPASMGDTAAEMQALATNATLREDEWERIDERVNDVLRTRVTVADDLRQRGLVEEVSLGTIIRKTERLQDQDDAEISFDGDTSPQRDRADYLVDSRAVPVISADFEVGWRQLEASRTRGDPLDTANAEQKAAKVSRKLQDLIANGLSSGTPTGGGLPGLTSAGNRLTDTLSNNWDTSSGTPVEDVKTMLESAYSSNLFGPFIVYVPKNYWAEVQDDYKAESEGTFIDRIERFEDIEAVRPLDALADDNVVMVQMTRDVLDLSEAQAVTTVQWERNPFVTNFRVLTVAGPHIKNIEVDDGTTVNGIVHLS